MSLVHPTLGQPAPNTSLRVPRILQVFFCGLRFDGWVLRAPSLLEGLAQHVDAPVQPLSILTLARPLFSGPKMHR